MKKLSLLAWLMLLLNAGQVLAQASLVKDIYPLSGAGVGTGQGSMIGLGNSVLFTANNSVNGEEIWISDGTEAGTKMLKDIYPGNKDNSSNPSNYLVHNGVAIFEVIDNASRQGKLYRTDGTERGTFQIWDRGYYTTIGLGIYKTTFVKDTTLYMLTDYPKNNSALVVKDLNGPGVRTVLDKSLNSAIGSFPLSIGTGEKSVASFDKKWFFVGYNPNDGVSTLYISDETKAGTKPVKALSSNSSIITASTPSGTLGFFVHDDGSSGGELWRTDGTPEGTKMVKNIAPGGISGVSFVTFGYSVTVKDGIIFLANDGVTGQEVWFSDGTETGTKLLKEFAPGDRGSFPSILNLTNDGQAYLFNSSELWKTDGTSIGTKLIAKLNLGNGYVYGSSFQKVGDDLYCLPVILYDVSNRSSTYEIVKINSKTDAVAVMGRIVRAGNVLNEAFAVTQNSLYYVGYEEKTGYELWKFPLCQHSAKINTPGGASFCPGSSVNIVAEGTGATGGYTYTWKQGTSSAGTNATLAVNKVGVYTVEVADSKGCVVSTSVEIKETTNLPVIATGASTVCAGQTTPLSVSITGGSGSYTYQWRLNGAAITGATASSLAAGTAGVYSVSVVDAKGCTGTSANLSLTQKPAPNATITPAGTTAILSNTATVLSTPAATGQIYQWYLEGQSIAGATNNTYSVTQQGNYTVMVTRDGCSATSTTATVSVILGTEPVGAGLDITVSPNPAPGLCQIAISNDQAADLTLRLLTASGQIIQTWVVKPTGRQQTLSVHLPTAGLYFLQADNGTRRLVRKIIRE